MILIAFRHGLRASELVALQWHAIDFNRGEVHIARMKGSASSTHPLTGRELRMLRRLQREQDPKSSFVFTSERGTPFATGGYRKMVARLGQAAGFDFGVHPHMLRHACGYALANPALTPAPFSSISAIATFSTRCATPNCRHCGFGICGRTD